MNANDTDRLLARAIMELLTARGQRLATAESCTSGRVAAALTSVGGASDYFEGGVAAYQNRVKERLLGVPAPTIALHDAVSEPVARAMALGCLRLLGADLAIATTGYTGQGSERVAAGTVWIACGRAGDLRARRLRLTGGREANTALAAETALRMTLDYLRTQP